MSKRFITEQFMSLISWAVTFQTVGQGPFHFSETPKRLDYLQYEFPITLLIYTQEKM